MKKVFFILLTFIIQNSVATIESCSGSSSLQLNNQPIRKSYILVLRSGDELSFTGSKHYSFVSYLSLGGGGGGRRW